MPRVCVTPGAVRVCEIDLDAVDGFGLVLLFRLQDELLEDRVAPCHDAGVGKRRLPGANNGSLRQPGEQLNGVDHVFEGRAYLMLNISYPLLFRPRLTRNQCPW